MKSVYLASCMALVLSACGGGKGDPLPSNPNTNAGLPPLVINGHTYRAPLENGMFVSVKPTASQGSEGNTASTDESKASKLDAYCPGNVCMMGSKLEFTTYGIQTHGSGLVQPFILKSSENYLTDPDKLPSGGYATYHGQAFTSSFASGDKNNQDSDINSLGGQMAYGKFKMNVDFNNKEILGGKIFIQDAVVSKEVSTPSATPPAAGGGTGGAAGTTPAEEKKETVRHAFFREYDLNKTKIVGNHYAGTATLGFGQSQVNEAGQFDKNVKGARAQGTYRGAFYGPNAENTAGTVSMEGDTHQHHAAFGGIR